MKTFARNLAPGLVLVVALAVLAPAALAAAEGPYDAAAAFAKLKSLEGEWHGKAGDGPEGFDAVTTYRTTAAGSAVVETLFPGTEHEMVTVYYMDGDQLVLVHYCAAGNQPRMAFVPSPEPDVIAFDFAGGSNVDPAVTPHMHAGKFHFRDDGSFVGEWQGWDKGALHHTARFEMAKQ